MKATNITLMFNGQTEEAFNFYKSVFDTEFTNLQRMKDIPGGVSGVPANQLEKILYISIMVGPTLLAGMDVPTGRPQTQIGTNFLVSLETDSVEETEKLFNRLVVDGRVIFPLGQQFWSDYFGMLTDKFGVQWMLNYRK